MYGISNVVFLNWYIKQKCTYSFIFIKALRYKMIGVFYMKCSCFVC